MYTKLLDAEWLRTEYIGKLRTQKSIALDVGCSSSQVGRALKKHGITRRKRTSKHPILNDKEWLRKAYMVDMRTQADIAREVGCTVGVIRDALRAMGIKTRSGREVWAYQYGGKKRLGSAAHNWRGGRHKTASGYIYVYKPEHPYANKQGCVMEHRLVMEEHIGRYIRRHEVVHHLDGNHSNNAIENLELTGIGQHISNHFHDSFETVALRKRIEELEAQLLKYKERYGDIE